MSPRSSFPRPHLLAVSALAVLLVAYHAWSIAVFGVTTVNGLAYFLVDDDIMISLRYARNLADGAGLVFNAGERIEGFTNPLLTLYATGLHVAHVPIRFITFGLQATNVVLSLAILWRLTRAFPAAEQGFRVAGSIAGLGYVCFAQHLYYAHTGYEVYAQALLALIAVLSVERLQLGGALAIGLLPLTHATSSIDLVMILGILMVVHPAPLRRRLAIAATALVPGVVYELVRLGYYGDFVPNTYWTKVGTASIAEGLRYTVHWVRLVLGILFLAGVAFANAVRAAWHARREGDGVLAWIRRVDDDVRVLIAAALVGAHVVAVVRLGGDYFPQSRFLFPASVLVALMAGRGGELLVRALRTRALRVVALPVLVVSVGIVVIAPSWAYRAGDGEVCEGRRDFRANHLALGMAVNRNTPPEARVAAFGLGYLSYFSRRSTIDMLGKADRHIAREPPRNGVIAHRKRDPGYVLSFAPDIVDLDLPPEKVDDLKALEIDARTDPHPYRAELALFPEFRRVYAHNPVRAVDGHFVGLYARTAALATNWVLPALLGDQTLPASARDHGN